MKTVNNIPTHQPSFISIHQKTTDNRDTMLEQTVKTLAVDNTGCAMRKCVFRHMCSQIMCLHCPLTDSLDTTECMNEEQRL